MNKMKNGEFGGFEEEEDNISFVNKIEELSEENRNLLFENNQLKNQSSEFLGIVDDYGNMKAENCSLKQEMMILKSNNDELSKRLDICIISKNELEKRIEEIRITKGENKFGEREMAQRGFEKTLSLMKTENSDLQNEVFKMKKQLDDQQKTNSYLDSQLNRIMCVTSERYSTEVKDVSSLINLITKEGFKPLPSDSQENVELIEKLKEQKERFRNERKKRKNLEQELLNVQKEKEVDICHFESLIAELKSENQNLHNSISEITLSHNQEMAEVEISLNKRMRNEVTQTQCYSEHNKMEANDDSKLLEQTKLELKQALRDNIELIRQVKEIENLKTTFKMNCQQQFETEPIHSTVSNENQSLKLNLALKDEELRSMESQLLAARASHSEGNSAFISAKAEIQSFNDSLNLVQSLINSQKSEILDLYDQRNRLLNLIEIQNKALIDLPLNQDLIPPNQPIHQQEVDHETKIIDLDISSLPSDLQSISNKFLTNDSLSIESKLKIFIDIIRKWIENHTASYQTKIHEISSELEDTRSHHKHLLNSIQSITLCADDSYPVVLSSLERIHQEFVEMQTYKVDQTEKLQNLFESIGVDSVFMIHQVFDEMKHQTQKLCDEREQNMRKLKEQRQRYKRTKALFKEFKEYSYCESEALKQTINKQKDQISEQQSFIDQLQNQNNGLIANLKESRSKYEDEFNEAQTCFESALNGNSTILEEVKFHYETRIVELSEAIKLLQKGVQDRENEVETYESKLVLYQNEIIGLKSQLNDLVKSSEIQCKELIEKYTKQITNIENRYEEAISLMRSKAKSDSELINKTTEALTNSEARVVDLLNRCSFLQQSIQQAEVKHQNEIESITRSNKLNEAQVKVKMIGNEMQYSLKFEELKNYHIQKEREIYGFIANSFKSFYDPSKPLTFETIRTMISFAKRDMERLAKQEKTIRSLIKAPEKVPIDEAVASLYLSNHPILRV